MKKLAIFVEGRTELIFVQNLIEEIAGRHNVIVEARKILGGTNIPRAVRTISAARPASGEKYYVLIYDCGGDNQVKTRILEEHEGLTAGGYELVIGIRDVKPQFTLKDLPKLERGLRTYVKTSLVPVEFILGVMEVEAWFLAEHTHFARVHKDITCESIRQAFGFDPSIDDMSSRLSPADDLSNCYGLQGLAYEKGGDEKTMGALDYSQFYVELGAKIPYVGTLNQCIDRFLS